MTVGLGRKQVETTERLRDEDEQGKVPVTISSTYFHARKIGQIGNVCWSDKLSQKKKVDSSYQRFIFGQHCESV